LIVHNFEFFELADEDFLIELGKYGLGIHKEDFEKPF
jgi:hypothetical protein